MHLIFKRYQVVSFGALDLLFTDQKYQPSLTYIRIVETFSLKGHSSDTSI